MLTAPSSLLTRTRDACTSWLATRPRTRVDLAGGVGRVARENLARDAGLTLHGAPFSDAVGLLGREHQARVFTRSRPRLEALARARCVWRRVIAGEKPACYR